MWNRKYQSIQYSGKMFILILVAIDHSCPYIDPSDHEN